MPHWRKALSLFFISLFYSSGQDLLILQTTDIHSAIFDEDTESKSSWLRLSSKIKAIRNAHGPSNTLLVDCGDSIQGALSGTISRGAAAINMLNHLQYDAWVPGNHELDFGSRHFLKLCKRVKVPILAGNFEFIPEEKFPIPCYKIYNRANKKILLIGMQSGFLNHWSTGSQFDNCRVYPAVDTLKKTFPEILAHSPDMIILALHQGLAFQDSRGVNEVIEIAKKFPEINLILGGHTHRHIPGYLNRSNVLYVQAGCDAEYLGKVRVKFKSEQLEIQSQLITIDENVPIDQEAFSLMSNWHNKLLTHKRKIITSLDKKLKTGKPGIDCEISHLIGQAILNASGADIAIHGRLSNKSLEMGQISEVNLFEIVPYENDLFKVKVSKNELITIMEEQMEFIKSYSFNAPFNFNYHMNDSRVSFPEHLENRINYSLCINSRVAAGGGKRFPKLKKIISQESAELTELPFKTRDAVRRQLQIPLLPLEKTLLP